jgi:outer membrane lipoprotein SlyB
MNRPFRAIMLAAAFTTTMGAATMAHARTYHTNQYGKYYVVRGERVYVERYTVKNCRSAANKGTAIGAIGGGVLGNVLGHNTTSTVVGVGVGAVAGHQIAKNNCKRG